jgi:hypothetical protein
VQDGRIHPARIEEIVAKTFKNIEDEIIEIGERTIIDLGIHGLASRIGENGRAYAVSLILRTESSSTFA